MHATGMCHSMSSRCSCADQNGWWVHGWDNQARHLSERYSHVSLAQRRPQIVWRGRSQDVLRDVIRCASEAIASTRPAWCVRDCTTCASQTPSDCQLAVQLHNFVELMLLHHMQASLPELPRGVEQDGACGRRRAVQRVGTRGPSAGRLQMEVRFCGSTPYLACSKSCGDRGLECL